MFPKKSSASKTILLTLITAAILFGCKKNGGLSGGEPVIPETAPDLATKVTAAEVTGFVSSETDAAVQNATVEIGGTTVSTDKYGYFEVRNAQVVQNAATVTVNKAGYFKTVKTFIASAGKSAFFRIKLLPKTNAGSFTAASGGTVTLAGGMAITIPAAGVVNAATNATYTGTVSVAAQMISAANPDLNRIMPGDLRGLNTNGNLRLLTTYGMMAVELTGTGGELLQIATGKKATITMPIPAALQAGAPANIPLWYFDEVKGLWKEEGSAAKTGSNYVGEVSHFSFWNYDVPANYVHFNCTIVNQNGLPLQNMFVKVVVISTGAAGYGYTDSRGYTGGAVPGNAALRLEVYSSSSNNCTNVVYTQNFTTTTSNISLGNITLNAASAQYTVSGTVTTCSNAPVVDGFIIVQSNSQNFRYPVVNGSYNFTAVLCSVPAAVAVVAEDAVNLQQSLAASYTLNTGNNALGNIQACGAATQQFMDLTASGSNNGTPYTYNYRFSSTKPGTAFLIQNANNSITITAYDSIAYSGIAEITMSAAGITVNSQQPLLNVNTTSLFPNGASTVTLPGSVVTITEYGAIGEFIAGNFTCVNMDNAPPNSLMNVSCNFRVRR